MKQNMRQSRIGDLFNYSSKRQSSFLEYHMKFSHCHVDITGTEVGADLGSCQSSMMKLFAKKNPS